VNQKLLFIILFFQVSPRELIYETSGQNTLHFQILVFVGANSYSLLSGISKETQRTIRKYASAGKSTKALFSFFANRRLFYKIAS
jgi:hypothetical protein